MDNKGKFTKLAKDILALARNNLVINLRFIDKSISMLKLTEIPVERKISVDGKEIFYNPVYVIKKFAEEKTSVQRMYLHLIMHCIFQHFWVSTNVNKEYWDLACDIAVEHAINDLQLNSLKVQLYLQQQEAIEELKKSVKYITADLLYRHFTENPLSQKEYDMLKNIFSVDNHDVWYERKEPPSGNEKNITGFGSINNESYLLQMKEWKAVAEQIKIELETFSKKRGDMAGALTQNLKAVTREKYNYKEFLKKFAVMGERMKINDDEFDYIFYTLGLNLYGKMPLIEPLEYKEVKQIKEFIIAIDTSGSVSGELVQTFVQKTYNMLKQEENFSTRFNIHIIQCDSEIQEAVKITCQEDFDLYLKNMTIKGLGGTDFRPVFNYVDTMIQQKEFSNLKGMIYFTDGFGIFPKSQPPYNVAVVYIDEGYENPEVPVWAIKLVLSPEEIKEGI